MHKMILVASVNFRIPTSTVPAPPGYYFLASLLKLVKQLNNNSQFIHTPKASFGPYCLGFCLKSAVSRDNA